MKKKNFDSRKLREAHNNYNKNIESASSITNQSSKKHVKKKSLLFSIMPKSGYLCVGKLEIQDNMKVMKHYWFNGKKEAINFVKSFKSNVNQIFVSQASFKTKGTEKSGRKQDNAAFLRVFFQDIDCGMNKPYATQEEGRSALESFCKKTGLPLPAIINSGNGLYAYWKLIADVEASVWRIEAEKLKKLVAAIEPGLDNDGIIADSARMLRPVGSFNRKDQDNPKKVTLLKDCNPMKFSEFKACLDDALIASQFEATLLDNNYTASVIADQCGVIAMLKTTRGNVSEPLWYACIGVLRHCDESPEIIHEWSMGHPNYSRKETDAKIIQHKLPPTTCEHFAKLCVNVCSDCEHYGKIVSPIKLGIAKSISDNIPDYIEALNRYHFVSRLRGKTYVFKEAFDKQLSRNYLEKSSFGDFRNFHINKKIPIGTRKDGSSITTSQGIVWLEHECRRQYEGIIMSPEGDVEGYYNLWRGYSVKPIKGSWKLIKKHIKDVLCNGDKDLYQYVKKWLARMIQEPWKPGEVALVLRGGKGIGKGLFANNICRIFGQHSCSVRNPRHVTGNFNAHLADCILLYVDEAFWAGSKDAESVLKGIITEPTIFIEPKFIDGEEKRNMLHLIMTSNNDWVVPASYDERRFCVLDVSECHKDDRPYFKAIFNEINNGGLEAMLYDLINMDISDFEVRDVPKSEGLIKQKILSLESVHTWWLQKLQDGELLPGQGWNNVGTRELYDDYVDSAKKQGNRWPGSPTSFGIELQKVLPRGWPKKDRSSKKDIFGKRPNVYEFPSLKKCRKYFEEFIGVENLDWGQFMR